MNYLIVYKVKNYTENFVRTFDSFQNLLRFVKYNDFIESYKAYRIQKYLLDLNTIIC